eukprot:4196875-Pleurochrysis_carterae.AAC.1
MDVEATPAAERCSSVDNRQRDRCVRGCVRERACECVRAHAHMRRMPRVTTAKQCVRSTEPAHASLWYSHTLSCSLWGAYRYRALNRLAAPPCRWGRCLQGGNGQC